LALNKPARADYNSVDSFCTNEPLACDENSWIQYKEDLITLRPGREHAWLDAGIERLLRWCHCSLVEYIFCSPVRALPDLHGDRCTGAYHAQEIKLKTEGRINAQEVYYSRSRIEAVATTVILVLIVALLIVPIYILYHIMMTHQVGKSGLACFGILLVSTLLFSAQLLIFTKAKRHEILAAAAAYCAVLVVFLGNVPQLVNSG
jgi:hypothetical protein